MARIFTPEFKRDAVDLVVGIQLGEFTDSSDSIPRASTDAFRVSEAWERLIGPPFEPDKSPDSPEVAEIGVNLIVLDSEPGTSSNAFGVTEVGIELVVSDFEPRPRIDAFGMCRS